MDIECLSCGCMNNGEAGTAIFFHVLTAFPSMSHTFLFAALSAMGMPPHIQRAIRYLYTGAHHFWRHKGSVYYAFRAATGVRQGCPLSALLFAITTNCILKFLLEQLGDEGSLRAYADDIAAAAKHIWSIAPSLATAFHTIAQGSNLKRNIPKCVVVPLWRSGVVEVAARLSTIVPHWRQMDIAQVARYLGVWIGPFTNDASWDHAIERCTTRSKAAGVLGAGSFCSVLALKLYASSVLHYIAQFCPPSMKHVRKYREAVVTAAGNPRHWIPYEIATSLQQLQLAPSSIPNLQVMAQAAIMSRVVNGQVNLDDCTAVMANNEAQRIWLGDRVRGWMGA